MSTPHERKIEQLSGILEVLERRSATAKRAGSALEAIERLADAVSDAVSDRAWQLYVGLVGASLHVDCSTGGELELGQQPPYADLAELAFNAARAFEVHERLEREATDDRVGVDGPTFRPVRARLAGVEFITEQCDRPPAGWWCSRPKGHEGPCATRSATRRRGPTCAACGALLEPRGGQWVRACGCPSDAPRGSRKGAT